MIAHHDELRMVPPTGGAPILAGANVRRAVLELEAKRLTLAGWSHAEIVPCRACSSHAALVA